jgi:hypothetical protein
VASHYLDMKMLQAKKTVEGFEHRVFSLDEVYWKLDEAAVLDHKFVKALTKSLSTEGMLWPPIVWRQEVFLQYLEESGKRHDPAKAIEIDLAYRVAIGNNRFCYAQENGYTHIECVVANTWRDKEIILSQTIMEYYKDF